MKKVGHSRASQQGKKFIDVSDTEEFQEAVDPSSSGFIYDNVDEFHEHQDRKGAEKIAKLMRKPKNFMQEEVLGIASSSEDESYPVKPVKKKSRVELDDTNILPALDSDLEEENDQEDEEKITKQWGKKRSAYYNADYVDEEWNDADTAEAEVAELEEQEALAIQQRMVQQLEEADFGLDFITHLKESEKNKEIKPVEERIEKNLTQLSVREKLKLINEESPELIELIEDFKCQMTELKENIGPLIKLIQDGVIPASPGANFVKAKYHLIIKYCTQIAYYFVLKSKRISVHNHSVIKRMVQFRALLHQLDNTAANLRSESQALLSEIAQKKIVQREHFIQTSLPKKLRILTNSSIAKKSVIPRKKVDNSSPIVTTANKKSSSVLTSDELAAVDFYQAVRKERTKKTLSNSERNESQEVEADCVTRDEQSESETDEIGKRGINYQIAKNKGLTPHRSKEQRNPRVKNRMKFRKAKIRRKGAIREVRKELSRYGGEISGIKASVVRSVKLK